MASWSPVRKRNSSINAPASTTPPARAGLLWNDKDIGIDWPVTEDMDILLSDKDKIQPTFQEYLARRG